MRSRRGHNSGHLTFGPCVASQFEQQVRAVCGLPLGSTEFYRPAAMANLLGEIWNDGEPNWAAALTESNVKLHLYGKAEPKPGRKMGHLTATAPSAEAASLYVRNSRELLKKCFKTFRVSITIPIIFEDPNQGSRRCRMTEHSRELVVLIRSWLSRQTLWA